MSNACTCFSVSAVRVQLSHLHSRMDTASALWSLSLVSKLMYLLLQMVLTLYIADMATAILILISIVEVPYLLKVDQTYLKASTSSRF